PWKEAGQTLRLHSGLEDIGDQIEDLKRGFERLHAARRANAAGEGA
ncbi:MAG: hypothetical protein JO010_08850, partial [Alphaproteobacteria bacterium]|nr:hypothetical protein [Alphaproteobacteria bacterium]